MGKARMSRHRLLPAALSILLLVLLPGCDLIMGLLGAPTPEITGPSTGYVGDNIVFDASGSGGKNLQYRWSLTTPSGSASALTATSLPTAEFVPDVVGTYTAQLELTNDVGSASANKSVVISMPAAYYGLPTGLTGTAGASGSVTVSWTEAQDVLGNPATSYRVYQSNLQNGTYIDVTAAETDGSNANVSFTRTLSIGQTAWFKVKAVYGVGTGAYITDFSAAVSVTAGGTSSLVTPTLSLGTITNYSVSMSWAATTGATNYKLYRASTAGGTDTQIYSGTSTSYTDNSTTLVAGNTYYYSIAADYATGTSPKSAQIPATLPTSVSAPLAPTGLAYQNLTSSAFTLTWTASTGATSYSVYLNGAATGTTTATYYNFTALAPSTTYSVTVVAANSGGSSPVSTALLVTTPAATAAVTAPAAPAISSVVQNSTGSLIVSWNVPSGATASTTYAVYRDTSQTGTFTTLVAQLATTSFTDVGLAASTTYWYAVKASNTGLDAYGNTTTLWSALSTPVQGTTIAVTVNYAPYQPTLPSPSSNSSGIDPTMLASLSWDNPGDPEGDPLTWDLFIGATGSGMISYTGLQSNSWTIPTNFLSYGTTYTWYVVVRDNHNNATFSPTWSFSTMTATITPPVVSIWIVSGAPSNQGYTGQTISLGGSVTEAVSPYSDWTSSATWILNGPSGSTAALSAYTGGSTSFTPDIAGYYYVYLKGSTPDLSIYATASLTLYVVANTDGTATINLK